MFVYVEAGVRIIESDDYDYQPQSFYNDMNKMYADALTLAQKENLLDQYTDRALKVIKDIHRVHWWMSGGYWAVFRMFYEVVEGER